MFCVFLPSRKKTTQPLLSAKLCFRSFLSAIIRIRRASKYTGYDTLLCHYPEWGVWLSGLSGLQRNDMKEYLLSTRSVLPLCLGSFLSGFFFLFNSEPSAGGEPGARSATGDTREVHHDEYDNMNKVVS